MVIKSKALTLLIVCLLLLSTFAILARNYTTTAYGPIEAELTGNTADSGKDTDGNGKYDYLEVTVEINVSVAGTYRIEASHLMDQYGGWLYIPAYNVSSLDVGTHWLNLSFYGPSIYGAHFYPKTISEIYLYVWEEYYHKFLDDIINVPLSQIYDYTYFDCAAVLTGAVYDEEIDTDHDGLLDALQIGVEIEVMEKANYMVNVEYFDIYTFVPVFKVSSAFLTPGIQTINVSVYGPTIFSYLYESKGNFSSVSFSLSAQDDFQYYNIDERIGVSLSKIYYYYEFESHAYFTGNIIDHGVDEDGDGLFDYLEVGIEVNVTEARTYRISLRGLTETKNYTLETIYYEQSFEGYLDKRVHIINLTFPGPMIAYNHLNPTNITDLRLEEQPDYYQLDYIFMADLPTKYNYTQFNPPFKDMEIAFTVYPNGTIGVGGKFNSTHMYPPNEGPLINTTIDFSTSGGLTTGSATGRIILPVNDWPFNSTTANLSSQCSNGLLNATLDATIFMPPEGRTIYPTNSSDFTFNSAYSNGLLNVDLSGETIIPSYDSMFPFNVTDFTVLADYDGNEIKGNITFHILSGFPLGDVIVYFNGNKTDLYLTGNITVIYGKYFDMEINATTLEGMLDEFNSTIPGPTGLVYNATWGLLECTQLNTTKTPVTVGGKEGAKIDYNATIHGNFTGFFAGLLANYSQEQAYPLVYAALDSALSSVQKASLVLTYYHISGIASIDLHLASDVKALWSKALELILPTVPPEAKTQVEVMLKIANATAYAIQDFSLSASYSHIEQKLNLNARLLANITRLEDDVILILPDVMPPPLREIVESYVNTTYCTLTSSSATFNYTNGTANFEINWTLQGDFKAQISHTKRFYIDYLNATSPWMLTWQLRMLNETEIDINNFSAEFKIGKDWMYLTFNGLVVQPSKEEIDFIRFKLHKWLNMTSDPEAPPHEFEKLKIVVTGGFNGTHTILLYAPGTVPAPDTTSLDYKTMTWQNVTISSLKDLLFKIAYQGVVDHLGKTYYVPIFTNSTVSNFHFNPNIKSISFNVTGTTGIGFCNVTIPRALLYANPEEWVVKIDGITLSLEKFNVTENAEYVFLYLNYSHSGHSIEIMGTWVVTEFQPNMPLIILIILSLIAAIIAVKQRKRLSALKTKYQSTIRTFASRLYRLRT